MALMVHSGTAAADLSASVPEDFDHPDAVAARERAERLLQEHLRSEEWMQDYHRDHPGYALPFSTATPGLMTISTATQRP